MAEFGKIDDPVESSFEAWPAEPADLGKKFSDLALAFGGLALTSANVWQILKNQFANSNRFGRIEFLLTGIRLGLQTLQSENADDREKLRAIEEKLKAPRFSEAVSVACEEAARATSERKIQQLSAVLVGSVSGNQWADPNEDIPVLIRDVGQLGEVDVCVLGVMEETFRKVYGTTPNLVTNQFVEHIADLSNAMAKAGMHQDDFYGTCLRLSGFGLATEERPAVRANGERCFRPTRRGLALLNYLQAFGSCKVSAGSAGH